MARNLPDLAVDDHATQQFRAFYDEIIKARDRTADSRELEPNAVAHALAKHLESLLERMPPRTRDVFMLCRVEGMTHKETARYLRISTSSVQKHMAMALARIGRALEPDQEG